MNTLILKALKCKIYNAAIKITVSNIYLKYRGKYQLNSIFRPNYKT